MLTLVGCEREPPLVLPRAEPFIALERDFQGFEGWHQIELPKREAQGITHRAGDAVEFVNQVPKPGQQSFPVGTILVKKVTSKEHGREMFAMVKRGGGFNSAGAHGWEWFELVQREDDSIGIKWRGLTRRSARATAAPPTTRRTWAIRWAAATAATRWRPRTTSC